MRPERLEFFSSRKRKREDQENIDPASLVKTPEKSKKPKISADSAIVDQSEQKEEIDFTCKETFFQEIDTVFKWLRDNHQMIQASFIENGPFSQWVTNNLMKESQQKLKKFSLTLVEEAKDAKDTRAELFREEPMGCFVHAMLVIKENPDFLNTFLLHLANTKVVDWLYGNLPFLNSCADLWKEGYKKERPSFDWFTKNRQKPLSDITSEILAACSK